MGEFTDTESGGMAAGHVTAMGTSTKVCTAAANPNQLLMGEGLALCTSNEATTVRLPANPEDCTRVIVADYAGPTRSAPITVQDALGNLVATIAAVSSSPLSVTAFYYDAVGTSSWLTLEAAYAARLDALEVAGGAGTWALFDLDAEPNGSVLSTLDTIAHGLIGSTTQVLLPPTPRAGQVVIVCKLGGTDDLLVDGNGKVIDAGDSFATLSGAWEARAYVYAPGLAQWKTVAGWGKPPSVKRMENGGSAELLNTEVEVIVDVSSLDPITVFLPPDPVIGQRHTITNSGGNPAITAITIDPGIFTINGVGGGSTAHLAVARASRTFVYEGGNWAIVGGYL